MSIQPIQTEHFRPIPGYEGHYKISNLGTVKSIARTVTRRDGFPRRVAEKFIYPTLNQYGTKMIVLSKDGKYELRNLKHLMMEAFNPEFNIRTDKIVNKDGDKSNFSINNLKSEMRLSRAGGKVIVDRNRGSKPKTYLTIREAGKALKFDHIRLLDKIAEGEYEPKRGISIKFEIPFEYRKKTFSKIEL